MNIDIEPSWKSLLQSEFEKEYFKQLMAFVDEEYATQQVFPPQAQIFNAFDKCPLDKTKVVILGQDPYHDVGQAHGLCFSVNYCIKMPPSLVNIFKEIRDDIGQPIPISGNLEYWAEQGVLLLNATLTVRAHHAGSHQGKGWEIFTDKVISLLQEKRENIVFLLWGAYACKKVALIDANRHCVLTGVHPSPLSAYRGFFGCKHFSKANEYLISVGKTPIEW
ncbi:MAG: uracil-DNA glycosylase [Paludibacteraceae bacterium]|nr:uracil-DNA glycosylase [Paludibacteraceae bacterium]